MLARVPIISAYDPSRESMIPYAAPSNKNAIMITGLVIVCLGTNNFLVDTNPFTKHLSFIILQITLSFISFKVLLVLFLQTYPITPTK